MVITTIDPSEELRRYRALAYERRLIVDIKKRRWNDKHSCTLCHNEQRIRGKTLCKECLKYEEMSTFEDWSR